MKTLSNLANIALIPILAFGLEGCKMDYNSFHKEGIYNGYGVQIWGDDNIRKIKINDGTSNEHPWELICLQWISIKEKKDLMVDLMKLVWMHQKDMNLKNIFL